MLITHAKLIGVRGVGDMELTFRPNQRAHVFIGENGVGKTKCLEALFQYFLFGSEWVKYAADIYLNDDTPVFRNTQIEGIFDYNFLISDENIKRLSSVKKLPELLPVVARHSYPVVYLASQRRGYIQHSQQAVPAFGNFVKRRELYCGLLFANMRERFNTLGMDENIEEWFVLRGQSASPFMRDADNRRVEIDTLMQLMNKVDARIDPTFVEYTGDNRVSIKIEGEPRELSQLSSGFTSILKLLQGIIAGYANLTNEVNLAAVRGIVLIDEIESHLHLQWQTRIVGLLKSLFPNTVFYIATHSPLVVSQLTEGEVYRLARDSDGVVRSHLVLHPDKALAVDLLNEAFGVDFNQLKRQRMSAAGQREAKKKLLELLERGESA